MKIPAGHARVDNNSRFMVNAENSDMKDIINAVRKQIMDELAPKIKLGDYASHAFTKLHFADIEALRSRVDKLGPEDGQRARVRDVKIRDHEDSRRIKHLEGEIIVLKDMIDRITADPMKLMRVSIDNFKLGDKK